MRTLLLAAVAALLSLPGAGRAETLYFIHVDHLGTPRLAVGEDGVERWRWEQQEPFGDTPAIEQLGTEGYLIDLPLRFPGQYADKETGLHYNYFRVYAPGIGRYVQSDPIGLRAGLNTYAYVHGKPLLLADPLGLVVLQQLPGITESGVNTVTCNGTGGLQILLEDPLNNSCILPCLRAHEETHLNDFKQIDPNVCAGAVNRQAISVTNSNLLWILELRAYEVELKCLRDSLSKSCSSGPCDPKIRERIADVESIINEMRQKGTVSQ